MKNMKKAIAVVFTLLFVFSMGVPAYATARADTVAAASHEEATAKAALAYAIGQAAKRKPSRYTAESYKPLVAAVKTATDLLAQSDATAAEMDAAMEDIYTAIDQLDPKNVFYWVIHNIQMTFGVLFGKLRLF